MNASTSSSAFKPEDSSTSASASANESLPASASTPVALDPRVEYLLRLGDTALVLGQQLGAWTAHAPVVEEDLALTNVALDLIGEARQWLSYAGELEGRGRDADALAYFRSDRELRNVLLVERPNGNFADTLGRQFLFDTWHVLALERLGASGDARIAALARKVRKEASYHARRSADWVTRLGDGTELSHARMQAALDALWPYVGELFEGDDVDADMVRREIGFDPAALHEAWAARVHDVLKEATLARPSDGWMQHGGKRGVHSEHLAYLLAEMQSVRRSVPGEQW